MSPVQLIVRQQDAYRTVTLDWHGGLRYPRLEKIGKGDSGLDRLLAVIDRQLALSGVSR